MPTGRFTDRDLPLVSVVIPLYNHENYVADCIRSILSQDYPNIDLIVIDDGSTDGSRKRVEDFIEQNGERFKFISKKNEGLVKTLNLGLGLARGKYFSELASDDVLLPGSIRRRVEYLEKNPSLEAVFANGYLLDGFVPTTRRLMNGRKLGFTSAERTVADLVNRASIIIFPTGMIRKAALDSIGGFDEDFRYYEDIYMPYMLAKRGRIGFLDEPVQYRRVHSTNVSKTFVVETFEERILALEKMLKDAKEPLFIKTVKKELVKRYWKYYSIGGNYPVDVEKLKETFLKAVRMRPFHYKTARLLYRMIFSEAGGPKPVPTLERGNDGSLQPKTS